MLELFQYGRALRLSDLLGGVLLERGSHGVGVRCFEEHHVPIFSLDLKRCEVDAVLPGNPVERTDILVRDLDALHPTVLGGKLLDGHFAVTGFLALLLGFHLFQQLCQGFPQFLFRQPAAAHNKGNNSAFNFFLHDASRSFPGICREKGTD